MIKSLIVTMALTFALGGASMAVAQTRNTNPTNMPPGQAMQSNTGKTTSPGASSFTPGHQMQNSTKSTGPGASEHAPGHTTGSTSGAKRR